MTNKKSILIGGTIGFVGYCLFFCYFFLIVNYQARHDLNQDKGEIYLSYVVVGYTPVYIIGPTVNNCADAVGKFYSEASFLKPIRQRYALYECLLFPKKYSIDFYVDIPLGQTHHTLVEFIERQFIYALISTIMFALIGWRIGLPIKKHKEFK